MRYINHRGKVQQQPPRKRYGLGSVISAVTGAMGIEKCGDCGEREEKLNNATDRAAEVIGVKPK